jgi:N-acetylmuramoyl-L-alanine amidase
VEQVRWHQDDSETYRLRVQPYTGRWWGYDARYEGSAFVFELRSPPVVLTSTKPLEGITVAVDPGHSPDTGAIGPTCLVEKDANFELARALEKKLVAQGAKVVLTRVYQQAVSLYDRPKIAFRAHADLLVSIHNNALPDGEDPFKKNGYGVYYYHPLSLPLARDIHDAYGECFGTCAPKDMSLRDDGLYYDNLAIPRATQMPSVLTETCYIMFPREEALLRSPEFRDRCADALTTGITRYVNAVCKRIQPPQQLKKKKGAVRKHRSRPVKRK